MMIKKENSKSIILAFVIAIVAVCIAFAFLLCVENDTADHLEISHSNDDLKKNVSNNIEMEINSHSQQNIVIESDPDKPDQVIETEQNYIVECQPVMPTESEVIEHELYFDSFEYSELPEQQLSFALFAEPRNGKSRLENLISFNNTFSANPMVLIDLVDLCVNELENSACSQQLIEQAIQTDGDNGALWLNVANFYINREDYDSAKLAIKEVSKSSNYNSYYFQQIAVYINSLKGSPMKSLMVKAMTAFGISAAKAMSFNHIIEFCRNGIGKDNEIANICLNMGKTMENRGDTMMMVAIGNAIQQIVHKAENSIDAYNLVKEREDHAYISINHELSNKASILSFVDENLFQSWMNNLNHYGEVKAAQLLIEEAIYLSKNEYYSPCDN